MKVRIKSFNGELIDGFSIDREYEIKGFHEFLCGGWVLNDNGSKCFISLKNSRYLNGGSWEIIE